MRINAGKYRGRALRAPKGYETRPTTDRVREAEMNVITSARQGFEGAVVLDAFAGTGALGLEALSRGADRAWFFETSGDALRAINENVKKLGVPPQSVRIRKADVLAEPPVNARPPFDIVFLDPPYAFDPEAVLGLVAALARGGALAPDVIVMYEHEVQANEAAEAAAAACGLALARRKHYGDTIVDTLRLASWAEEAEAAEDADEEEDAGEDAWADARELSDADEHAGAGGFASAEGAPAPAPAPASETPASAPADSDERKDER